MCQATLTWPQGKRAGFIWGAACGIVQVHYREEEKEEEGGGKDVFNFWAQRWRNSPKTKPP